MQNNDVVLFNASVRSNLPSVIHQVNKVNTGGVIIARITYRIALKINLKDSISLNLVFIDIGNKTDLRTNLSTGFLIK